MPYTSGQLFIFDPAVRDRGIAEMMNGFIQNWLERNQLPDEQLLYHYTTASGLKGILENKSLWFGHFNSFNDSAEIKYGKDLALDILKERREELEEGSILDQFYGNLITQVRAFGTTLHHAYISCFCEKENLLSQWREYSNQGGGYCLGFNFTEETYIKSLGEDLTTDHQPILRKVIYDEDEQRGLVNDLLNRSVNALEEVLVNYQEDDRGYLASVTGSDIGNLLIDLILAFKDSAFEAEREWRLVRVKLDTHRPEKLFFRRSDGFLVPYLDTHIFTESEDNYFFPIDSLRFGPTLENERTEKSLELFLNHLHASNDEHEIDLPDEIEIMDSNINLRN